MVFYIQCQNPECRAIGTRSIKADMPNERCKACNGKIDYIKASEFEIMVHFKKEIPLEPDTFNKDFEPERQKPRYCICRDDEEPKKEAKQSVLTKAG